MKIVEIRLSVYVPDEILSKGDEAVCDYLNDKLYMDPEFYGTIDMDSITVNNTHYEED